MKCRQPHADWCPAAPDNINTPQPTDATSAGTRTRQQVPNALQFQLQAAPGICIFCISARIPFLSITLTHSQLPPRPTHHSIFEHSKRAPSSASRPSLLLSSLPVANYHLCTVASKADPGADTIKAGVV